MWTTPSRSSVSRCAAVISKRSGAWPGVKPGSFFTGAVTEDSPSCGSGRP
jgi:hypothetical protein